MSRTLAKPWNRATPGTVITTETEEAYRTGALLVDPARFAHLEAEGFFEPLPETEVGVSPENAAEMLAPPLPGDLSFKGTDKAIPLGEIPREASFPTAPPPLPSTRKVTR